MGAALIEREASARQTFAEASAILGYDLARLCLEGPEGDLTNTLHAQPALLVVGALYAEAARARGLVPDMAAGHSLGEYAALVAAGALDLPEALKLVKYRAELMADAPAGTMAALIGLPDEALSDVLQAGNAEGACCSGQL